MFRINKDNENPVVEEGPIAGESQMDVDEEEVPASKKPKVRVSGEGNQVPVYTTVLTKLFRQQFSDGDIIMLYHLVAKSKASVLSGLGYIKELTYAKFGKTPTVNKPSTASTVDKNRKAAAQRLSSLHSRIAKYNPIR